ncbi:Uncharacterized membrane protein [Haladaptatus paucihalophilus DX253]|uniref:Uncharacterized membrane protein n=2 Tax=Haladaptatus paucihalophilus DX253 TaxID=797209 RepID=A0A1M6XTY4_HALPU|nr:Uncharacterized membrane protein [Haladaptatus paucihalophilus DX253]
MTMIDTSDMWQLLPRRVRRFPADLGVVIALVLVTVGVVRAGGVWTPVRLSFGFLFLFFLPGYSLVAVLFPEASGNRESDGGDEGDGTSTGFPRRIDGIERITLSIAVSLAVVPLIGYLVSYSPWGLNLDPSLLAIGGFTIVCALAGAVRQWTLPESDRFSVPIEDAYARFTPDVSTVTSHVRPLNVLLVVSLVVATAGIVYTTTTPRSDERFTEFYLGTKNASGSTVTDAYPKNFTAGDAKHLRVGIGNHEYERSNYTVVVLLQRVKRNNGSTRVTAERRLDRFHVSAGQGQTVVENRSLEPTMTGERLRLQFLLYRGAAPASPSAKNAYRRTHLWIRVHQ